MSADQNARLQRARDAHLARLLPDVPAEERPREAVRRRLPLIPPDYVHPSGMTQAELDQLTAEMAAARDRGAPDVWCWDCDRRVEMPERWVRGDGPLAHYRHHACGMPLHCVPRHPSWRSARPIGLAR